MWTGTCGFNQRCRAVGAASLEIETNSGRYGSDGVSGPPLKEIGDSGAHPRTGSIDLAVGVGVGMCLGGAAVFIALATMRKRRLQKWRGGGESAVYGGIARVEGEEREGRARTSANKGGCVGSAGGRWPRRRHHRGFSIRGKGTSAAAVRQVALELGRDGFDRHASDEEEFAALRLRDGDELEEDVDTSDVGGDGETEVDDAMDRGRLKSTSALPLRGSTRMIPDSGWGRWQGNPLESGESNEDSAREEELSGARPGGFLWETKRKCPRKSGSQEALLGMGDEGGDRDDEGPATTFP